MGFRVEEGETYQVAAFENRASGQGVRAPGLGEYSPARYTSGCGVWV